MEDSLVWAPHPTEGFILGKVVDIGSDVLTVQPIKPPGKTIEAPYDRVFTAAETEKDVDDNCALMYLNEGTLLNNIRIRYQKNNIYTFVANILIAVNPYFEMPKLYAKETIHTYIGKSLGQMPPHVFAIADKSFRDMRTFKESQAVIVSGESGAGKTETTKYILKYLVECFGAQAGPLEQRILESNPLLEAFGNAKTVRNNNSSRFGKFIEIHFNSRSQVTGGFISHYLLEKSRICVQSPEERNYHIFYRLCAGANAQLRQQLDLATPDRYHYLKRGITQFFVSKTSRSSTNRTSQSPGYLAQGSLTDNQLDDVRDFERTDHAMGDMGLNAEEKLQIYRLIAAVLHLGNIEFKDSQNTQGGCLIQDSDSSKKGLQTASNFLGIPIGKLQESLTSRFTQAARGGAQDSKIQIALRVEEAISARDALAKAVYSRLFDYIVQRVNQALPFKDSANYIGVLDIAGFEYFDRNSFEQFCINYCNEKLQQFFNLRVLKEEQILYEREGLGVQAISFVDNQDCIDLIERKSSGIFDLLDEESRLPKPTSEHFTSEVHGKNSNHFRLLFPRKSKLKSHREVRDSEGFLIRHFAGAVCYHTDQFIEKNNDALHASLEQAMLASSNPLVQTLFKLPSIPQLKDESTQGNNASRNKFGAGKLNFISVGSKFRSQLTILMEKLKSTGTNFIRCLKPNTQMVDHCFEGAHVLSQLECSGMPHVLQLMQEGFPSRAKFDDLYNMYRQHLPPQLSRLEPRLFSRLLFKALGLNERDFKFGTSKVFFRPGKFAEFDTLMRSDPASLVAMVQKVRQWLLHYRWRKAQYCVLEAIKLRNKILWRREKIIKIQKTMRMWICCKRYRPRINALGRIRLLQNKLPNLMNLAKQIKKDSSAQKQVDALNKKLEDSRKQIQTQNQWSDIQLRTLIQQLNQSVDGLLLQLKQSLESEKARAEQERLKQIQEQLEAEKRKQMENERRLQSEEEERRSRGVLEEERRKQAIVRESQEREERSAAEKMKKKIKANENESGRLLEQERLDHELALRLAKGDAGAVEDISGNSQTLPRSTSIIAQRRAAGEYDLSSWKYAQLRDTINTSCDVALLKACREEFHRRLKVYNDWKNRNKQKASGEIKSQQRDDRAPPEILKTANERHATASLIPKTLDSPGDPKSQRFFRVPFSRPLGLSANDQDMYSSEGMWWVHFDGQYVVRQMELQPNLDADLRIAGVDDDRMFEMSLHDSGLLNRKGAAIPESEFEREWERQGGMKYINKHRNLIGSQYLKQKFKLK